MSWEVIGCVCVLVCLLILATGADARGRHQVSIRWQAGEVLSSCVRWQAEVLSSCVKWQAGEVLSSQIGGEVSA